MNGEKIVAGDLNEGDILVDTRDGEYFPCKILRIDRHGEGDYVFHVLLYKGMREAPRIEDLATWEVFAYHVPVGYLHGEERLGNVPVTRDDLVGFLTYLEMTDFGRYAEETGQDINEITREAMRLFNEGNRLCEQGEFREAIGFYQRAVDKFPPFYEAIDNKGLAHMDLAEWDAAMHEFQRSLDMQPDGYTALFSMGECEYKLGHLGEAAAWFEKVLATRPGDPLATGWLAKARAKKHL